MIKRPHFKRFLLICFCILLIFAAFPQAGAQIDPTIRVLLKRLKIEDSISLHFQGQYMLSDGSMTFADDTELTVVLREGHLVAHAEGLAVVLGSSAKFIRCQSAEPGYLLINGNSGMYEGDLQLDVVDGAIRPILHIHIEDYLLGVVPYEMGDSFPLEALKAQAIAARTYALQKSGSSGAYDVEDTTNDQAFKGRSSSSPLSEQAVRETAGLCGTYQSKLAQCYYSASNGGQTELGQHVWPSENPDEYGYMDMRDDPYDYANAASSVKRFTLNKKPGEKGVGTALHSALVDALAPQLLAAGHQAQPDTVRIDEITSLSLSAPKYDEPSRLMTEMTVSLKISVRECTYRDAGESALPNAASPAPDATPTPTPRPTATPAYSPYTKLNQIFTVTLPIFPTAEKAMGLSINVYQNELITVMDIGNAYMIESRRFGHGVGMSQRGAQQMAQKHGKTYTEILEFYYPRMDVTPIDCAAAPLPTINASLMSTPAPTPSPTPRPTLMPVSEEDLPKGAYIAVVSNIDDDSSLNLRQSPSLSADVLRRLYKNQRLIVLKDTKDGWSHVKTDVIEGYVRSEYLQTAQ